MSKFLNMLGIRTRAIAPPYVSQWKDTVIEFAVVPEDIDYLQTDYPYSIHDGQIDSSSGAAIPTSSMRTLDDQSMLTIDDRVMEVM
jgi:hypothetical protein